MRGAPRKNGSGGRIRPGSSASTGPRGARESLCRNGDGRKAFRRGLCASCYEEAPRIQAPAGEGGQLGPVRVRPALIRAMEIAASAAGTDLAGWRRGAYWSALQEAALRLPEVRELLNSLSPERSA